MRYLTDSRLIVSKDEIYASTLLSKSLPSSPGLPRLRLILSPPSCLLLSSSTDLQFPSSYFFRKANEGSTTPDSGEIRQCFDDQPCMNSIDIRMTVSLKDFDEVRLWLSCSLRILDVLNFDWVRLS